MYNILKKMFLFFFMLLLCSFFRLKELFQVKNGLTTPLLLFFQNAKNLGRSDDGKQRKKRMAYQDLSTFDKMSRIKKGNERHNKCRKLK